MHERHVTAQLIRAAEKAACGARVKRMTVCIGAVCGISPEGLRNQLRVLTAGTALEGASVDTKVAADVTAPHADAVVLESLELEEV